ncbi:MAG: hypothetical protein J0I10_05630 [Verrucomicrobia bacterium]|nr:hypothetical protein [Verrucomicrobiota bacterium]
MNICLTYFVSRILSSEGEDACPHERTESKQRENLSHFYRPSLALVFTILLICGCTSKRAETQSVPSPDGTYTILVTKEYQPANDSEPFWQHISILRKEVTGPPKKGNLFTYSSNTSPKIYWIEPKSVMIEMRDVSYSFEAPLGGKASSEISITATITRSPLRYED